MTAAELRLHVLVREALAVIAEMFVTTADRLGDCLEDYVVRDGHQ